MIATIASSLGLQDNLVKHQTHRHGSRKENRSTIIKVSFTDVHSRDQFIRHFNCLRSPDMKYPNRSVTCRRDSAPTELQQHYGKKLCYQNNAEAGEPAILLLRPGYLWVPEAISTVYFSSPSPMTSCCLIDSHLR